MRLLMRLSTIIEADDSMGEDARSITYFDMYVTRFFAFCPSTWTDGSHTVLRRILQREGERDLFALRQPAMPSDDDADDGHEIGIDSSDDDDTQEEEVEVEL